MGDEQTVRLCRTYSSSLFISSDKVVVGDIDEVEARADSHGPLAHRSTAT